MAVEQTGGISVYLQLMGLRVRGNNPKVVRAASLTMCRPNSVHRDIPTIAVAIASRVARTHISWCGSSRP